MTLTADEMNRIVADITLGIEPADSKLAPMTEEQLAWRTEVAPEVRAAMRAGRLIELPAEFPDAGEVDR